MSNHEVSERTQAAHVTTDASHHFVHQAYDHHERGQTLNHHEQHGKHAQPGPSHIDCQEGDPFGQRENLNKVGKAVSESASRAYDAFRQTPVGHEITENICQNNPLAIGTVIGVPLLAAGALTLPADSAAAGACAVIATSGAIFGGISVGIENLQRRVFNKH